MGRNSTGAITTGAALRIELSYLLKNKLLQKGSFNHFYLSWNNDSRISCTADWKTDKPTLRLTYTITDRYSGTKTDVDHIIYLATRPSNLGKGETPYFICPQTGHLCRILYKCYGSEIFKSRNAYRYRIYYPSQISSKLDFWNSRYWQLEHQISKLQSDRRNQTTYNRWPTKFAKRLERLKEQREYYELMRWQPAAIPQKLLRMIEGC